MKDFSNFWNAISFAFTGYGNLKRKSKDIPYVIHPIRITTILRAAGFNEFDHEDLMIAALFHDLLEDTNTNLNKIENQFGKKVGKIIVELTKPEGAKERKKDKWLESFVSKSKEAKVIKLADRIDNLMDMRDIWDAEKQRSYTDQAMIILNSCGDGDKQLALKLEDLIKKVTSNL
ncbi:MAG: HD domain-containing protein [Promethearchaeota archaeon]|jgi:guanosine-3',5'-bis(diphosphate) 3'-pyrophosphohydrolase